MARTRPLMDDLMEALAANAGEQDPAAKRTQQQTIIDKLIEQANKGEARAAQLLITLKREGDAEVREAPDAEDLSAEDQAILEAFTQQARSVEGIRR
jgi:hypothetical protein